MQPQSGGQMKHEEPMGNGQWPRATGTEMSSLLVAGLALEKSPNSFK